MSYSYSFTVTTPKPAEEVFDYLADMRNLPEWDPEVAAAWQTGGGEAVRVDAAFRLEVARGYPPRPGIDYQVVELERPSRIVARGVSRVIDGVDTYTIAPEGGGSKVTYASEIDIKGLAKVLSPWVRRTINRSGEKTRQGLERTLNR